MTINKVAQTFASHCIIKIPNCKAFRHLLCSLVASANPYSFSALVIFCNLATPGVIDEILPNGSQKLKVPDGVNRKANNCFDHIQKAVKKSARREQLQREETEQRRLKSVLELQYLLDQLGEDCVRQDLKHPDASGAPLLTDAELSSLDEFYKLVGPERNYDVRLTHQYEEASLHLWELLEGRDKAVAGTTCKYFHVLISFITHTHTFIYLFIYLFIYF
uniref:Caprin-1 dimerization domain-containing protein n=1 Tax=Pundamilia nyererei TaxID=303518 RepID=A0A3B4F5R1_9CICH